MLEAVNSVISNAPFLRQSAEQSSSAQLQVAQSVIDLPDAPYVSPYVYVNNDYDKAVLQIRDSETGDVLKQFPSEETLAARQRQAESELRRQDIRSDIKVDTGSAKRTSAPQAQQGVQNNLYTEAQKIASSDAAPVSRAPSPDAVSAAISAAAASGTQSSGKTVSVQA